MLNKPLPMLGALIFTGAVMAQAPVAAPMVGVASNVQGLVTVSNGTTVDSVTNKKPFADGNRIVTSSTGTLTLDYSDGCVVSLTPNQSVTIDSKRACVDRNKAVVFLLGSGPSFAGGLGPMLGTILAGITLVSGGTGGAAPAAGGGGGNLPDPPPLSGQ